MPGRSPGIAPEASTGVIAVVVLRIFCLVLLPALLAVFGVAPLAGKASVWWRCARSNASRMRAAHSWDEFARAVALADDEPDG
mmetsp:Transcript_32454/g.66206  ORF Transcript_32454/g.66206 Transcript_32454/m.66206 type:complete len:83 (-) Transcript_32454:1930-2178(-)